MKKVTTSLSVIGALLMAAPAFAIVNIEAVRNAELEQGVTGEAGLAVSAISSATDELRVDTHGRIDWLHSGTHNFVVTQGSYAEVDDVQRRRTMAHVRHVQALNAPDATSPYQTLYNWEVYGQTARDDYAGLRQRSLVGTGLRLNRPFVEAADHSLGLGVMSEWRQEETDEGRVDSHVGRANMYLGVRAEVGESINVGSTAYFQPRLDEWDDFSAIGEFFVDKALTEQLSLRFVAGVVHDSNAPDGMHSTREEYGLRVVYQFGQ